MPYEKRCEAVNSLLRPLRPLCDGVAELLWLMRESGESTPAVARNGVYQHTLGRDSTLHLLRVSLSAGRQIYPEISAGHHRFTLRFMPLRWYVGPGIAPGYFALNFGPFQLFIAIGDLMAKLVGLEL